MTVAQVRDLCRQAERHHEAGEFRQGLLLAERAVSECAALLGRDHYAYPMTLITLGWLRHAVGEGATALFAEAAERADKLAGLDFENAVVVLKHAAEFASANAEAGRLAGLGAKLVTLHRQYLGDNHPRTVKQAWHWSDPFKQSVG